jgi:calcineurin-like phosphoesterase family protein
MTETYAIGDIHGEVTLLRQLLSILPFKQQDTLVFLGDYLDRGEDSIATILELQALQDRHPSCVFLRGNHEDAWLDCWNGRRFLRAPDIDGAMEIWQDCDEHIPAEIGYWLAETRIDYEDEYAYYVHAGLKPSPPQHTPPFFKMWGIREFLDSHYNWGKPVIFGHWSMEEPLVQPNKIGIDTGAYESGVLTALRLPDRQLFQAHRT